MLIKILTAAVAIESCLIALLVTHEIGMLRERRNFPGIFIKFKKNKDGKISLVYSNDKMIKKLEDVIPETHINHCTEIFDVFLTNGVSEFICEKNDYTYNVSIKRSNNHHGFMIISDVTDIKKMSDKAYIDSLTGLPNRLAFNEGVKSAIFNANLNERVMVVMFLDLDRFKAVNDTFGHEAGDELLRQVAERLCGAVRGGDTVARIGGDEFTVLLPHVAKIDFAYDIANRIISELTTPFDLGGGIIANISTSIGIAIYPNHGTNMDIIIKHADAAMYAAKKAGRGCYRVHEIN
jgi:diguanylate cyclase (GGDEF)-like protein